MNFPKASPFLFIGIVLSSLLSFVVNAQSLLDYRNTLENFSGSIQVIKNHHPNDVLRKTELAIHDIPHILDVKDSLPKIEYLRLKFKTQKELDSLCSFLPLFPNLKAISFDEWFYRDNAHKQMALVLPEACYTLHKLVAIEFRGQSKINVEQELARISKLPNFRYLICTAFNPDDFPRNIAALKKLRGISFTYDATLKGIKLPANLEEIDIVALRDSASLADAFGMVTNPKKVKQLAISYFRLGKDFKSSVKFPTLDSIYLYANEFQDLGAFLSNFNASRHLRSLVVERGKIAMISSAIYDFRNLRKLKIYNTRGGLTIPDGIAKLRHLARLDLSANGRADIPKDLYKLKSLQQLDLSYIGLASLTEDIGLLANLRYLKLQGNRLVKLPNSINKLHGLTTLDVQGNLLTQIPSLSNLTSLDSLNLSGCRLTTLPTDIGALQSLRYLSVGDNFIERLPSSMTQLMLLSELLLAGNLLSELMDDIGSLEQLEQLNLSLNHLKTLPISMGRLKRLKTLNLSQNVLTTIPEEIGTLSNLEYFYAQNNVPTRDPLLDSFGEDDRKRERQMAVSRLHTFPKDLSAWRNIKEIDLSYNDFSSFDILQSVFTIPTKDFELNLSDSRLKTLPVSGWRNFRGRKLDLLNNDIGELPEKIAEAPQLSVLDLRRNRLPERPKNQNTYAGKRNDVLLYFEQAGLIDEDDLPKNKDMALALMEKSSRYYYEKDYKSSLEMHSRALATDSTLVFARCNAQYIGEANYYIHNYTAAIDYLTRAIQRDTVGPVRIMNFVVPEFKYRAKSYLARKDTSKALADYLALANRFDETFWTQVAMLYGQTSQVDDAQEALQKAVDYYERQVNGQDVRKDQKELSMLCILELYIVCNQFERAAAYAQAIESSLTEDNLQPIFHYLCAINDIVSGKPGHFSPDVFKRQISNLWGYDLVLEWLSTAPLDKKQASVIGDMTSGMVANRMK